MSKWRSILVVLALTAGCENNHSREGDAFFKRGQYKKAVDSYTTYLTTEPRDIKTIYNRGRAYHELGEYKRALADFRRVVYEDPLNTKALMSIAADYYDRLEDYENAVFYADKVLKLDEANADAFTLKGKAHQKSGNVDDALEAYNSALRADDEHAGVYMARSTLWLYQGKRKKGCSDLKMAELLGASAAKALIGKYCH